MKQFKFKEDKTNRPVFDNWVRLNGCMWFWDINFNGLFFYKEWGRYCRECSIKVQ